MGGPTIQTLFLRVLPDTLRIEITRRPELKNLELMRLVDWARHQTMWDRSEELAAQIHKSENVGALRPGGRGDRPGVRPPQSGLPQPRTGATEGQRPPRGRREPNALIAQFKDAFIAVILGTRVPPTIAPAARVVQSSKRSLLRTMGCRPITKASLSSSLKRRLYIILC